MQGSRFFTALLLSSILLLLGSCGSSEPEAVAPGEPEHAAETAETEPPAEPIEAAPETEPAPQAKAAAPKAEPKAAPKPAPPPTKESAAPVVAIETSMGVIQVELYPEKAPETVANFLQYARSGFYEGTIFHRVIPDFMIQGGGLTPDLQKKETREPIQNEATNGLKNERGTIAMARTANPHSATAQFFINHVTNPRLDNSPQNGWGYAVFGKVIEGMDVVDEIAAVETGNVGPHQNVPKEPVVIEAIRPVS